MEEVREVGKLKLNHDVLMGAKNSLGDKYLLVYYLQKKNFQRISTTETSIQSPWVTT